MSTTAAPPTQVTSVSQGVGNASIPIAPHRATQREGSSSNLGTFGVR